LSFLTGSGFFLVFFAAGKMGTKAGIGTDKLPSLATTEAQKCK
jgi:hypothetical protein